MADVSCPHARGGEPEHDLTQVTDSTVVPTHVGVNRRPRQVAIECIVVPTHVGVNR